MSVRLYAVLRLRRKPASLPVGLDGERLRLLKWDAACIVFAEASAALEPTPLHLLAFDRVIRHLATASESILPARFGVVAENAAQLKKELNERADALMRALDVVAGREQMTLRVSAGQTPSRGQEGPALRTTRRPGPVGPGKKYLQALAAAAPENSPQLAALRKWLANVVRAEIVEAITTGVTAYHLVDRSDAPKYRAMVRKHAGDDVRVSGPFPPYAFVPGIDHALWLEHDDKERQPPKARPARSRPHRRSPRNPHR